MISPLQFILGWFGYVKIPIQAVQLSMGQEEAIKLIIKAIEKNGIQSNGWKKALEAQQALTKFLRSGRLLA